jgi:hypothetical protein
LDPLLFKKYGLWRAGTTNRVIDVPARIGWRNRFLGYLNVYEFWLRDGIFKLFRIPGIDSKESIPPAFVAWRAGMTTLLFLLGSYPP